jgi:nitroreductase
MKPKPFINKVLMGSVVSATCFSAAGECYEAGQKTLKELMSIRQSGYSYDSSKPVDKKQLREILEAGRLAPSSYNEQPWVFIVCDRTTDPVAYDRALSCLVEFNQNWAKNAPVLIISIASTKSSRGTVNEWAKYDTGAAAFAMMLEATDFGLMAHQMGGFDAQKLRTAFAIPTDYVPMSVMAIGYRLGDETRVRERKPIGESFFSGSWGTPFDK